MTNSERNQDHFLDGFRSGVHCQATYAAQTSIGCPRGIKRTRTQSEVMQAIVESSPEIQWQLYALLVEEARKGNPIALHLRGAMAVRFDEIEPVDEEEEEHQS